MAVADMWEHTWRSGMIVRGTEDEPEGEPVVGLGARMALLAVVGLVAAGALTAHVRLHVLEAEQRRLLRQIADMMASTELLRCQVVERSKPALISAYAEQEGLRPPVRIAEMGPPTRATGDTSAQGKSVGAQLRHVSRATARNAASRLGVILRGPTGRG